MIELILAVLPVFIVLVASEYLWQKKVLRGEAARKLVHIAVGSYVAFWPWYLSTAQILQLCVAFLVVVSFSQIFNIFHAIHGRGHRRVGEILFAISIGVTALLTEDKVVFAVAILHLSLADGLAGLVGTRWGKKTSYQVLDQKKSLVGTGTFVATSFMIILIALILHPTLAMSPLFALTLIPVVSALAENVGIWSTDNILVPLAVVSLLSWL